MRSKKNNHRSWRDSMAPRDRGVLKTPPIVFHTAVSTANQNQPSQTKEKCE